MNVTIRPSRPTGAVQAPPSKSMAHRLLIAAGLSQGTSIVRGLDLSEDVLATMDCLRALGAEMEFEENSADSTRLRSEVTGKTIRIRGTDPARAGSAVLPCRESGSTLRFFAPLCMLSGNEMRLTGSETLLGRPLGAYEEICRERGIAFCRGPRELLVRGKLAPGEYVLDGNVSSQFVTGLLFALPLTGGDSVLRLRPPVESRSYIDMTMAALRQFGIEACWRDGTAIEVPGGGQYRARDVRVEGDWSNAAFFLAMGVPVEGLSGDSLQGDRVCEAYFRALEAGRAELSLADCPDLGPVLFAFAAMHHGGRFTGTRRLRIKESDRGEAMRRELAKFGVPVEVLENEIRVGSGLRPPKEPLCGHNDHRIVMALAVLCTRAGGTICGAQAVRKSFPDFFRRLEGLGIEMETTP